MRGIFMKKFTSFILVLVLVLSLFSGCSKDKETSKDNTQEQTTSTKQSVEKEKEKGKEEKPSIVRYGLWGSEEELKIHGENIKGCEEVFPGVKIEIQSYPSSEDFWNNLPAQIAAKTAPDILKITNEGAYEYVEKGLFEPLDEYIKEANLDLSSYTESAQEIWKFDGKTYGIPISVVPAMFFINKAMWNEAGLGEYPTTWEEVKEAAKKLTTEDVKGLVLNLHEYHITNYALSYGGGWGNGKTINSPENVQALETILNMYEEGVAITPKSAGFGWDGEVFANKKGAMSTGGYWYKGYLKNAAPDLEYDVIPMPKGTVPGCTSHSDAMVVLQDAQDKLAATKAVYYLTRDEALEKLMENVGINPAKTELSAKYYEANPEFKAVESMTPYAKDFGYPADTKRFIDLLIDELELKVLGGGEQSAQEILDKIQTQFK